MTNEHDVLRDKAAILARMAESRRTLRSALDRASPEALERPGTWGAWSIKDLLAHITYWQGVATDRLQKIAAGRMDEIVWIDEGEIDALNANVYQANKDRPLAEMREAFDVAYLTLRTAIKSLRPAVYAADQQPGPVRYWVAGNSYLHDEEHLGDVEQAIG
jgi:hypothetical protein